MDWLDWMLPEAWNVEHNNLHHYKLGEQGDPDLVERNFEPLRSKPRTPMGMVSKYAQALGVALIWKWFYYAPNTLKELEKSKLKKTGEEGAWTHLGDKPATIKEVAAGMAKGNMGMANDLMKCLAPYAAMMFLVIPGASWLLFGAQAAKTALISTFFAEILTNIHSFVVIATNHVGDDIYKFDTPVRPRSDEFYLRAVIGSTNFHTGCDFGKPGSLKADSVDFSQGWLNYQIEHHMFPDLSMLQY